MLTKTFLLFANVLLIGCEPGSVHIGNTFFNQYCLEIGHGQSAMEMVDVNYDGYIDLVVVNEEEGELVIFTGDGSGNLQKAGAMKVGENPTGIDAGDIDGDGTDDIVIGDGVLDTAYVLLSTHGE